MKVLVLNNDYSPLNVTDLVRGFKLVFKGKAEVVEHDDDNPIVTESTVYKRPLVIRLLKYIVLPFQKFSPTRENIFRRDGNECLYCGVKKNITIDHVFPKHRGGKNTWQNMVTCCKKCNAKKDNKTPEEAKMVMKYKPFEPSYAFLIKQNSTYDKSWANYLK